MQLVNELSQSDSKARLIAPMFPTKPDRRRTSPWTVLCGLSEPHRSFKPGAGCSLWHMDLRTHGSSKFFRCHEIDPLHHLGQVSGGRSRPALQAAGSTWAAAPPRAGPGLWAGCEPTRGRGGRLDREARWLRPPPPLQQLAPSSPGAPDTSAQAARAVGASQGLTSAQEVTKTVLS